MSEEVSTLSHSHMALHLRMAATAAAALASCSSMDMLYQESAHFISSQAGVERCAVIGFDAAGQKALYRDETNPPDLSSYTPLLDENFWNEHLPELQHLEQQVIEYNGSWIALTPIRQSAALLAVLVNDSPISHSPINAETQELIVACCALLGMMIAHKSAEFGWAEERNLLRHMIDDPIHRHSRHVIPPVTDSEAGALEQTQAAETLFQSEERYRSLVELSPDGIAVYQAGAFVYANKALYRLLGALESDRLSIQQIREAIHPASLETIRAELMHALEEDRRSRLLEAKLIRTNQAIIDVEIMAAPITLADSDALQIIIRDVTERKRAEEIRHEAERLRIALEKERELGELKTRLMITISHEFRTPLAIVNASAELLEKFFDRMEPEQRARHLLKIQMQIRRLTEMIEDITLLIQATFEHVVPQFEPTDFAALCADATQHMQMFLQTQDRIVVQIEDNLPMLMLDQRRMKYVLTSLLSNALKYSPAISRVLLEAYRDEQFVVLRVTDYGIGIPASEQPHIFEPFYRAQNVSGIGGTGLGLSVVKDIVELHGGTIGLASELGQGTQVTILLPLKVSQNSNSSSNEASV